MADVASLVFDIDSSQARGAAKALGDLNSATIRAANGAAKFDRTMRGADGRFKSTSSALRENREEIERLAQAYNPVLAAQIRFRDESIKTGVAVKAGVITEQQRIDILQRTKASLDATSAAASRFGRSQEVATHHVSNLSFQLNDIGMMMALGQNPFMLMMQQGPQVAQILGQMNQEGRKLGPTLAGAFKMFLNPTTAVTLAVIGLTAALGQMVLGAGSAGKQAKSFADTMSELADSTQRMRESNSALSTNLDQTRTRYGALTLEVRSLVAAQGELARIDAFRQSNEAVKQLTESLRGPSGLWGALFDIGDGARLNNLRRELGLSMSQANSLSQAMRDMNAATTDGEKLKALSTMRGLMREYGESTGWANDEMLKLYKEVVAAEDATRQAVAASNGWASSLSGVLSQVNAISRALSNIGGFQVAAVAAQMEERLLSAGTAAGEAARQVAEFERASEFASRRKEIIAGFSGNYSDPGYKTAIRLLNEEEAAARSAADAQFSLAQTREAIAEAEIQRNKDEKAGAAASKAAERRAAAELKSAEKGFQSLRELMEKESIFQFAEYEKRQSQLEMALNKQLLTEQQYDKMRQQLRTLYFGSDYEIRALQHAMDLEQLKAYLDQDLITRQEYYQRRKDMQWEDLLNESNRSSRAQDLANTASYFGQLQSLSGSNSSKLLKIQQSFQAASALLNAYTGASQVLADPTAPWWVKIAAAGKVLAAGIGFASAIKGGGSGGGGSSSTSAAPAAQEPTRQVMINIQDGWEGDLVENLLTQIYEQTKDGRVVISRG